MGLESPVTKISDLNPLWPLGSDQKLAGDDHIRNIKTALQTVSFLKSIQTFTASGSWVRPAGVARILIYCLGGGGGGNGGSVNAFSGGGGSGGGVGVKFLDVSTFSTAAISIGAGGPGGPAGGTGFDGNDTVFYTTGSVVQCLGVRGLSQPIYNWGGAAAYPRTSNVGDVQFAGEPGTNGEQVTDPGFTFFGGTGGGSGGSGGTIGNSAQANSGGGGGGGSSTNLVGQPGGNGGSGYCVVVEFGQ